MSMLNERLRTVHARIAQASQAAGRNPAHLHLLCVSKTQPAEAIRAAHALGETHFGENYVQEALDKLAALSDLRARLCWHFIGPLQSNKSRAVAEGFDWVHSVDSLKLAQRLSHQRPPTLAPLQVCLQVNISGEASKRGVAPEDVPALAEAVRTLPQLQLRGLMSIPAPDDRAAHARLVALMQPGMDTLSMGMSEDLEAAVAAVPSARPWQQWLRVGSAVFGSRPTQP